MRSPPRPGSSPAAAAAHRPRGLPAGRSRVRGMSVGRRLPRLVGSQLSGGCGAAHLEREGRAGAGAGAGHVGRGPSARISGAGKTRPRPRRKPPTPGSGLSPGEARSPGRRLQGIPACREGQEGGQPARTRGSEGPPGLQARRRGFPGLGGRRLPSSRAVTASDVSASPRTEGTREGAGFWESRELCPLSCSKKPNQKANL